MVAATVARADVPVLKRIVDEWDGRADDSCSQLLRARFVSGVPRLRQLRLRLTADRASLENRVRVTTLRTLHLICSEAAQERDARPLQVAIFHASLYPTVWSEPCRDYWKDALAKGVRRTLLYDADYHHSVSVMSLEDAYLRFCGEEGWW